MNSSWLHTNNDSKCQLMMLLPNQFNKRTDFWIISITWLWLFPNQILCSFDVFGKRVFGLVGIKSIVFFLVIILIMAMFNFQFWVSIKKGSWCYLTCFFKFQLFSYFLLIVILFHLTVLEDLILCYFNLLYYWSNWAEYMSKNITQQWDILNTVIFRFLQIFHGP